MVAAGSISTPAPGENGATAVGGSALLAAVGAWLAGRDAAICTVIGQDVSTELIRRLTQRGIDLTRSRSIAATGAQQDMEPSAEQLASVSPNWSVHLCGLTPDRQRELLHVVTGRVVSVTIDAPVEGAIAAHKEEIAELASSCDAFLAGRHRLERLWPGEPPREILRLLARRGARAAVIKLGVGGSIGIREGRISWMSAYPLARSPVLPGGDAYAGAFSAVFAQDRNLARAMAWATAAASTVMESASSLDLLTEFGRQMVESRARTLESDTKASS